MTEDDMMGYNSNNPNICNASLYRT